MSHEKVIWTFLVFCFLNGGIIEGLAGQEKSKNYEAVRISSPPKIDGILDEEIWDQIPIATDFVMFKPGDGIPARETHATEVKIAYTDEAIFIAAYMFDNEPERIQREFAQRDNIPAADYFVVDLNTYRDGENQTRFIVTSAGTLADAKMKGVNEDYSYDVVWQAETRIGKEGWFAEIKIPFSALRFPEKEEQVWGLQFGREISHLNEVFVWNYVNKEKGNFSHYNGVLSNIQNIDPPVRLSLYPFVSTEVQSFKKEKEVYYNAGMDLKYGINEAFTLDVTLVPDFGQAAYDEIELNLGPFEQTFRENRAFFTEGTELFSKGNLFYSRRIGGTPLRHEVVQQTLFPGDEIITNPEGVKLINALKLSGRTGNGLGIGILNAITAGTSAVIENRITGERREIVTEPFSNYNIFVLDQQVNDGSSISLVNTNVTRNGHFRDGNVSAFLFDLYNGQKSFNFVGEAKMSNVNLSAENLTGFASTLAVLRTKGKFRYGLTHDFANETYDINDLGISQTNNYNNFFWSTSYRSFEPKAILSQYTIKLYGNHQRRFKPDIAVRTGIGSSFSGSTPERFSFGGFLDINSEYRDFFEPRRQGRFVLYNPNYIGDTWISSDYRKSLAYEVRIGYSNFFNSKFEKVTFALNPRYRISNRATLSYGFEYLKESDRKSFLTLLPSKVIFAVRDRESIENTMDFTYNFSTKAAVNFSLRNFWSTANFSEDSYFELKGNGKFSPYSFGSDQQIVRDVNFNIWNLDLSYQWRFAPGSELLILYRNSIFNQDEKSQLNYFESLDDLFLEPVRHSLSLKVIYYLDYNSLKRYL